MQPIATPITGEECLVTNQSALYALTGFYSAFNSRDLAAVSRNWAQTAAAGPLFARATNGFSPAPPRCT